MYILNKCTSCEDKHANYESKTICKEICSSDELFLDQCDSSIEEIKEIYIKAVIKEYKIIETCNGTKIFFHGLKFIKIRGTNCERCSKLSEACFVMPFCECITIHHCTKIEVCSIDATVLCYGVTKCSPKAISISTLIEICVKILENCSDNLEDCPEQWQCFDNKHNEIKSNIKFRNDELDCDYMKN